MRSVIVQTASRLHFGLLGWGPRALRQFGGLGLMIDDPGLCLRLETSDQWEATGPHASRALEVARSVAEKLVVSGRSVPVVKIVVERAPAEHVGLGLGTQLSLAVTSGMCRMTGLCGSTPQELAELSGRGKRSGIGLYGFVKGGLIVDGGRSEESETPTLLFHSPFPPDWRILLIRPKLPEGLHGDLEARAFRRMSEWPEASTDRLCRMVLLGVLPALLEKDLGRFGKALRAIQREVGAGFASLQGGTYSSPAVDAILKTLEDAGIVGLGQSSWGPTLYGFAVEKQAASIDVDDLMRSRFPELEITATWTTSWGVGAVINESG